jgi:hypothetical protein
MDNAWKNNWYHADRLAEDALEMYDFPDPTKFFTGTGTMPQGMFNAVVTWIDEEDDNAELRKFIDATQ